VSSNEKEGIRNILIVALSICLVCSVIVSGAAVALKPAQTANKALDQKENILRAAGLLPEGSNRDPQGRSVDEIFAQFEVKAVDLQAGEFTDAVDPKTFQPIKSAKDPSMSRRLTDAEDIATLKRLERYSVVYVIPRNGGIDGIVLPVRGYGLWGTLYGYLALDGDLETVRGLTFYDQKETPGLGGEVTNPLWKAQWHGVDAFDANGEPAVRLVKSRSEEGTPAATHEVDALSGATLTTRGVQNLIRFWTGDLGFGPLLKHLKKEAA
jgi:Na+-transporting NADH:ubiquinone oxidoreductase subunit C